MKEGGYHPVLDGFIVYEEYLETLLDSWNQEQEEANSRQKRVVGKASVWKLVPPH